MAEILKLDRISRQFGGIQAVREFSAAIHEGELVGLIGPNGAGKSTLFNVVSGMIPPSAGRITYNGEEITGLKPYRIARQGVGRTFQTLRIFPNMTVFDNVSIGALNNLGFPLITLAFRQSAARGLKSVRDQTWQTLERTNLTKQAHELAANIPYGQRKYLELARALATKPKLLLLDEPAAGLNPVETKRLGDFIGSLIGGGITILLVEHDMSLVMSICSRVIVLSNGQLIADGAPDQVRQDRGVLEAYLGTEQ